ncbi:unnamed protein product [Echinostoma caproni]|uniref:Reverse transcriptase domain-containing protein n=1 Tax=Echinostoma caproni TaxID=27848 RepID=A0A183B6W5_9TREM|nr:unnamed protein product [Echinostoma caproni]
MDTAYAFSAHTLPADPRDRTDITDLFTFELPIQLTEAYGIHQLVCFAVLAARQACVSGDLLSFHSYTCTLQALSSCEDNGIDLLPGGRLSDLEYAEDIVLLSEDPSKLQAFLDNLNASVAIFEHVDKFCYLSSYISPGGRITDEVSGRIQKARFAFANLRHLWRRRDIRLSVKSRVYAAAVRPVLLYGAL